MAKKKCKCPKKEEGAPLWVMTYGDMMSLLLVFFIMLVALSEIVEEERYRAIVEEIKDSFGMKGGGGKLPTDDDPRLTLLEIQEAMQRQQQREAERSPADDPGMEGRETTVTQVREGMKHVMGGHITFEPGSADLTQQGRRQLRQVAEEFRGWTNIVELRGHADSSEADVLGEGGDLWTLSYERSRAVKEYLTSEEVGVREGQLRLVANADREPLARRVYTRGAREPNRRVEVIVVGALMDDLRQPQSGD